MLLGKTSEAEASEQVAASFPRLRRSRIRPSEVTGLVGTGRSWGDGDSVCAYRP